MGFTSSIDVNRMHTWIRAQTFDSRAALVVRSRGTHREDVQGARHLSYECKLCASGLRECRNELLIRRSLEADDDSGLAFRARGHLADAGRNGSREQEQREPALRGPGADDHGLLVLQAASLRVLASRRQRRK
jgi:hypothetical protein